MNIQELASFILAAMISWSPLSAHNYADPEVITQARYSDIADQIALSVQSEEPLFSGEDGREKTALLLASIASYESGGFRQDVHFCKVSGDGGKAWGLFQSHISKEIVCASVADAARVAIGQARESFKACHSLPLNERLSGYAAGNCTSGKHASLIRMRRAEKYWSEHAKTPPTP